MRQEKWLRKFVLRNRREPSFRGRSTPPATACSRSSSRSIHRSRRCHDLIERWDFIRQQALRPETLRHERSGAMCPARFHATARDRGFGRRRRASEQAVNSIRLAHSEYRKSSCTVCLSSPMDAECTLAGNLPAKSMTIGGPKCVFLGNRFNGHFAPLSGRIRPFGRKILGDSQLLAILSDRPQLTAVPLCPADLLCVTPSCGQ